MNFIRPLFLWGLPLAALPLVLHFWGRRRAPLTLFSNVDVLRESLRDHFLPAQLRRWLLLIVRTALIAMIIISLARPVFQGALGSTGRRGVVLLDASYSMRAAQYGQSAFDRARSLARLLLESRRDEDTWGLVVFSDRVERSVPVTQDVRSLLTTLQSVEPTHRTTRYSVGLDQARSLLGRSGTVVVLSDMAAHGGPVRLTENDENFFIVAVQVTDPFPNGAITGLEPSLPGFPLRVKAHRWGSSSSRTWSVAQKGRFSARGIVAWDGETGVAAIPFVKGPTEIMLDNDSLPTDDRWYYAPPETRSGAVLVVNGAPSLSPVGDETYFVRPVLNRLRTDALAVGNSSPDNLLSVLGGGEEKPAYSVVLLFNPPPLSGDLVMALTTFVQNGGGVWVTAGDRGGWRTLGDLLPLGSFDVVDTDETMRFVEGPLLSSLKGFSWNSTSLDRMVTGSLRPDSFVVLETNRTRQPVLSLRSVGAGRVAFWGTSIDRDWTSFPARAAYPIMVNELIHWLSENNKDKTMPAFFVGDTLEQAGPEDQPLSLIRPDGKRGTFSWEKGRWHYAETDLPGFYEIQGTTGHRFAVNVRGDHEGNPIRLTLSEFTSGLGPVPGRLLSAEGAQPTKLLNVLRGWDLTPLLAKIILVLAALETVFLVLFRRRRS
ncbi:MAG: BatA and WFA domain-containing protein [Elusimicrobia bacterium]|nr:BatA and WFA domain-containing protein [Elusimicrobiota bacterium]MBP9127215.1 BatA and WFA domain-containing protein [Elusimicrobiota bacterium]MBP9699008.1 BatA and WFA domain-containing protein [Elusimicrobiota bacterium]